MSDYSIAVMACLLLASVGIRTYFNHSKKRVALRRGLQQVPHIHFDTTGWQLQETSSSASSWSTADNDVVRLHCFPGPGHASTFDELPEVRAYARRISTAEKGSLVWADRRFYDGVPAVAFICKHEEMPAYRYTGMIMISAADRHFIIAIVSTEQGITGVRDAIVTAMLFENGQLKSGRTDGRGRLVGWFRDPYDSTLDAETISSVSDDEQYDELVPSHPLSKIRRFFRSFEETVKLTIPHYRTAED